MPQYRKISDASDITLGDFTNVGLRYIYTPRVKCKIFEYGIPMEPDTPPQVDFISVLATAPSGVEVQLLELLNDDDIETLRQEVIRSEESNA